MWTLPRGASDIKQRLESRRVTATACFASRHRGLRFGLQRLVKSNRMTKQQLIEKVTAKTELGKAEVELAVDSVLELIAETLRSNERVDLRGFGSFVVKDRKERPGRNPRTGETITIAARREATFRPGKALTERLAQGETAPTPEQAL